MWFLWGFSLFSCQFYELSNLPTQKQTLMKYLYFLLSLSLFANAANAQQLIAP